MDMQPYIVYVRTDDADCVTAINSSAFLPDMTGWVQIDRGYSMRHHHAQGNYLPKSLYDDRGICRYKLVDGEVQERTEEEMDADFAARPAPEQTTEELLLETAADHEYRICLMELGVSKDDL